MTDRQVAEASFRNGARGIALGAIAGSLVILYHLVHRLTGLGGDLPPGLFSFCLFSLPFLGVFYLFSRAIRWVVLGFIGDKERRAERPEK
jgi:hypothetical protein